MNGRVKWFDQRKGFGFIEPDAPSTGGPKHEDVFVHYTNITGQGRGRRNLVEGDRVEFGVVPGDRGPSATNVHITQAAPTQKLHNSATR